MKCFICETRNQPGALYCTKCGASFRTTGSGHIPLPPASWPAPTRVEPALSPEPNRVTIALDSSSPAQASAPKYPTMYRPAGEPSQAATPRVVGFLLSHTLQPEGAYFPLREGRNTFGSQAAHENPALRSEPSLSPNHFSVIVRQSKVRVVDEGTESGTVVDGHTIKSDGMMVNHGSTINAGKHQFEVLLSAALTRAFSPHA